MSQTSSDTNSIERELDQTRSRLGSHLTELQDKFSPGQVLDDLMGYFRGSEGAAFGRGLMDNVRANPMPAAVTAIGLAWLMASKPTGQGSAPADLGPSSEPLPTAPHLYGREDYAGTVARVRQAEQDVSRHSGEEDHSYMSRLDDARGQAIGLARHTQETTESFGQRINDAVAAAEQAVASAMSAAGSAAGSAGASIQDAAQSAFSALSQSGRSGGNLAASIIENPVMLGALGLAAGALLGALVPVSEQEEAALGGIAGQAREAATGLAHQGLESGKTMAQSVINEGRQSASAHGLTSGKTAGQFVDAALSGELAGGVKVVVQDVLKKGDEAVHTAMGTALQ